MWGDRSLWFRFAFPYWLLILNIFSYTISCLYIFFTLLIFQVSCLSVVESWVLNIFQILDLYYTCAQLLQSCLTLCNPVNCSPPGSSVHGILQQEYWGGLPRPTPGDLPDPRIKPLSLMSSALAGGSLLPASPGKPSPHHISPSYLSSSNLL